MHWTYIGTHTKRYQRANGRENEPSPEGKEQQEGGKALKLQKIH